MGAPAVECSETEHEFLEFERLREVVVGAKLEPGGLVVETVGGSEHEDRHAAAGGDDAFGDLVAGESGNVSVEDGDVAGLTLSGSRAVSPSPAMSAAMASRRRPSRMSFCHIGLVLDDQHTHAPMLKTAPIVGVSKTAYMLATPRRLDWRRDLQQTGEQPRVGFRIRRIRGAGLLVVIAAIATALGYQLLASSSSAVSSSSTISSPSTVSMSSTATSPIGVLATCAGVFAVRSVVRLARPAVPSRRHDGL